MKNSSFTILLVDDDANDLFFLEKALRKAGAAGTIQTARDGLEAVAYLEGRGKYADRTQFQYPSFIITDLKMPLADGLTVLAHLNRHPDFAIIPTIVLSSSEDLDDIRQAYAEGASSYIVKPHDPESLRRAVELLYRFWLLCESPLVDITGKHIATNSTGKLGERPSPPTGKATPQTTIHFHAPKNEVPFQIETVLGHISTIEDMVLRNRESIADFKAIVARVNARLELSKATLTAAQNKTGKE